MRCALFCNYFEVSSVAVSPHQFSCQHCYDNNEEVVDFIPVLCGVIVRWVSFLVCQGFLIILKAAEEKKTKQKLLLSDGILLRLWELMCHCISGFSGFHLSFLEVPGWTGVERNQSVGQSSERVSSGAVKQDGQQTHHIPEQLWITHVKEWEQTHLNKENHLNHWKHIFITNIALLTNHARGSLYT